MRTNQFNKFFNRDLFLKLIFVAAGASLLTLLCLSACVAEKVSPAARLSVSPPSPALSPTTNLVSSSYGIHTLPSATEYSTSEPPGRGFIGSQSSVLTRTFSQLKTKRGISFKPDPRLATFCKWIYEKLDKDDKIPPGSALDLAARRLGLPEPLPHFIVIQTHDSLSLARALAQSLDNIFDLTEYTHAGGIAEFESIYIRLVVALSRRHVKLTPVPRHLAEPGRLTIEAKLLGQYSFLRLAHTSPDEEIKTFDLTGAQIVKADLDLLKKGKHRIELLVEGPRGPEVGVNFPVYVAVKPEEQPENIPARPHRTLSASEVQTRLYELINKDRSRHGFSKLELDSLLNKVALGHSEDMAKNGFVGHISPTTGDVGKRIQAAGIKSDLVKENIGRGYSADEIHHGLMESPAHRSAILHQELTHVGIGVVAKREFDRTAYLVTELFIRRIRPIDPETAAVSFLEELNRIRSLVERPPLVEDRKLSEIAGEAARCYIQDSTLSRNEATNLIRKRIEESDAGIKSAEVMFLLSGSIKEAAQEVARIETAKTRIGIGITQGTRPDQIPNIIVLVVIFAE